MANSVREARARYFAANGFSDATYRDTWVKVALGPLPFVFPNTRSRKRAIPLHDLHHVATGYATTLRGEAEIGAWEIASGCANHWAAWALDAFAFTWGLALAPRRVYRAFVRGRHSKSLYRIGWNEALLGLTVDELRHRLELDRETPTATFTDRATFIAWVVMVLSPAAVAVGLAVVLVGN